MKSLAGVVAMVLVSTAFAFGLAEAWLRVFPPSGMPISQPHPTLGYTYLPNIDIERVDIESGDLVRISTNEFGFRDDWSGDGHPRIMVVGDSYVAGVHVDEPKRFTELAEENLRASHPRVRVFNVGKGGTSTGAHLRYVEHLLPVLEPDLTIVSIYDGNDFEEINASLSKDVPVTTWTLVDGKPVPYATMASPAEIRRWSLRVRLGQLWTLLLAKKAAVQLTYWWAGGEPGRNAGCPFLLDGEALNDSFELVGGALFEIARSTRGHLALLQIPASIQVYPELFEETFDCPSGYPERWPPEEWLATFASKHDMPLLQLLPRMQKHPDTMFYWDHLNYEGHRFVADQLSRFILEICPTRGPGCGTH